MVSNSLSEKQSKTKVITNQTNHRIFRYSARAQVSGDYDTVRAQGPLGIQLGHFDRLWLENKIATQVKFGNTFTVTGSHGGSPAAVIKDWVRKLGMDF